MIAGKHPESPQPARALRDVPEHSVGNVQELARACLANPLIAKVEAAVPIDRLLNGSSLSPEKIAQLKQAYESALRALSLVDRNDPVAEIVARKIIEIGKNGGDAVEISKIAVKELGFGQQGPDIR